MDELFNISSTTEMYLDFKSDVKDMKQVLGLLASESALRAITGIKGGMVISWW